MVRVLFTPNLARHVDCPAAQVSAATVREALEAAFAGNARARGYILDDQSHLRRHIAVFVDGVLVRERVHLSQAIAQNSEIFVAQALSGG